MTTTAQRDRRALALMQLYVDPIVRAVLYDRDPDTAAGLWDCVPQEDRRAVVVLLAARAMPGVPAEAVRGWWTPARWRWAEHADERVESPRPLVVTWVGGGPDAT